MKQRAITAVFFVAAMLGGIYGGKETFLLLFAGITAGCLWELGTLLFATEFNRLRQVFMLLPGLLLYLIMGNEATGLLRSETLMPEFCLLLLPFGFLIVELFTAAPKPFTNVGHYLTGLFYVALPYTLLTFIALKSHSAYHPHRVFGLLWLVWTNDTAAYLIGSRIGRTKLFERISPKKTWEGTIAGAVCTVGMAWLVSLYFDDFTQPQWLALGAVAAVFGTLGDLVESMLKRSVGVKDSGTLLPGHGGLLDRFDAFMFMLPFAWLVVQVL